MSVESFVQVNDQRDIHRQRVLDLIVPLCCAILGTLVAPLGAAWMGAVLGGVFGLGLRAVIASPRIAREVARERIAKDELDAPSLEIIAKLPVCLLLVDEAAVVIFATEEAGRLLERDVQDVHLSRIFRSPAVLAAVEDALERDAEDSFDFRARRPRDMTLTATIRSVPSAGAPRAALLLQDNSAHQQIEDTRSAFVTNASHELRTPLAAISGIVETLQGAAKNDPVAQERFLGIISKQTQRMIRLVNDLLSLSRVELDEHIAPTSEQDLNVILQDVLSTAQPLADAAGAVIEVDRGDALPAIFGARDELVQIFVNLIENAIKYAGQSGSVRIEAHREGDDVRIAVCDSGPGIAAENIPRLTERFFRVDAGESRAQGGTGLGLAIVKHIVNRHRGSLEIESKLGKGSKFIVKLPIATSAPIGSS